MLTQTEISYEENGVAIVRLSGRFTLGSSMSLAESKINQLIEAQGIRKLVLDMTNVEHVDSAGLGLIVYMQGKLQELGGQIHLAAPNGRVMQLFQMTHTEKLLQIDPDVQTSLAKLNQ